MLKKILIVLSVVFLASCGSVKKHNATLGIKHNPEALRADVDYTYKKLQRLHPKLYQYIPKKELDRKFDSLKQRITKPLNAKEFYTMLTPVVAEVRQGHITPTFPDRKFTRKEYKNLSLTNFDFFELEMKYIEDKLWISRTGPKDSVLIGSQVVAVGMETIPQLFKRYRRAFASDGYNTTFQNKFLARRFTSIYRTDKGHRDSVSLVLMRDDSVYVKQFKRYLKDSSALKPHVVDTSKIADKKRLTKSEKKEARKERKLLRKRNKKYGFDASRDRFTRNFKFLDSAAQIGYIKIRRWNGHYDDFFEESFTKLDSAKAQHLVIDLRDNPGGSLRQIYHFYSYLTDADFKFINPAPLNTRLPMTKNFYGPNSNPISVTVQSILFPFFTVYSLSKIRKKDGQLMFRFKESKTASPNPLNFKGDIYVLINGGSFSASAILASKLHGTKRATFVGEETGGAYNGTVAGRFKRIVLPHSKIDFTFGLIQLETPHKQQPDGFGIKPDIPVQPTVADFLANRDTELEHVLDIIQQK